MSAVFPEIKLPAGDASSALTASTRRSRAAFWEAATIAVDSIWSHKMRSVLTLVGIIIGVASVVTVGGAIEGLGTYVTTRLTATFGSSTFMVARIARQHVSGEEWERLNKRRRIYPDDMQAVEERCESCAALSANLWFRDDAKYGNRTFYDANISGVTSDLPRLQQLDVAEGRFMSSFDVDHARPIAVIGADIRDEFFATVEPLGKEIKISGDSFLIVGIEKRNGTFFGQSLDNMIYIPYTAFLRKYGTRQSITMKIKASSAEVLESTQDEVRVIMRSRHKLRPNEEDDFDILASTTLQANIGQFTGAIAMVVTPITLISLIVGGIVIMNIMLVTVTERTPEIGLRKSVGARRMDILLQFVVESSLLAAVGGLFGLLLAYAISFTIRRTTPIPMDITAGYILLALAASGGIGILFGIYPAYKASKLDPIVALSRE